MSTCPDSSSREGGHVRQEDLQPPGNARPAPKSSEVQMSETALLILTAKREDWFGFVVDAIFKISASSFFLLKYS